MTGIVNLRRKILTTVQDAMGLIYTVAQDQAKRTPEVKSITIVEYQLNPKDFQTLCKETGSTVSDWLGTKVMTSGYIPEGQVQLKVDVEYKGDDERISQT